MTFLNSVLSSLPWKAMFVSNSDMYLQESVESTFIQKIHPNKFLMTFFCREATGPLVVKKMAGPRPSRIKSSFRSLESQMSHTALPWTAKRTILRWRWTPSWAKWGEVIQKKLEMGEDVGMFKPFSVIQVRKDYSDGFVARISKPRFKNIYPQKYIIKPCPQQRGPFFKGNLIFQPYFRGIC